MCWLPLVVCLQIDVCCVICFRMLGVVWYVMFVVCCVSLELCYLVAALLCCCVL